MTLIDVIPIESDGNELATTSHFINSFLASYNGKPYNLSFNTNTFR